MSFFNPYAQGGQPGATARSAQLRARGPLTPDQLNGAKSAYQLWKLQTQASLAQHLTNELQLPDGTLVRMRSSFGVDTVDVFPVGGGREFEVVEQFWGIPANDNLRFDPLASGRNGTRLPGGGRAFLIPEKEVAWPTSLKQLASVSAAPFHPGHLSWRSSEFVDKFKRQYVLSWRGPREKYAYTTGWSGGTIVPHNEGAIFIGPHQFTDSGFIWLDNRRVDTGKKKIIAAALHRPNPAVKGEVVLRICTDNYSGDLTTRAVGYYDLIPTGATGPVAAGAIMGATSFTTWASSPAPATWTMQMRPSFDKNGDRLATVITDGTLVTKAVSLSMVDWSELEAFPGTETRVRTGSQTITETPGVGIDFDRTENVDTTIIYFLAADYRGDNFVRMWAEVQTVNTAHWVEFFPSIGNPDPATASNSFSNQQLLRVKHSGYVSALVDLTGPVYSWTTSWTSDANPAGTGTFSGYTQSGPGSFVSFVGDLARDVFALGCNSVGSGSTVYDAVTEPAIVGTGIRGLDVTTDASTTNTTFTWDVWMAGEKRLNGTTGSFTNDANTVTPSTGVRVEVNHQWIDAYISNGSVPPPAVGTFVANAVAEGAKFPSQWAHCAVNTPETIAYVGIFHDLGIGAPRHGLEASVWKDPDPTLDPPEYNYVAVPNYAGGTPNTLTAPVFAGFSVRPA